ncbi:trigger factor [soil metagenome]
MQVSVESTSKLGRRLKVELPSEQIQKEMDTRINRLAKTVTVKGFRQGKAPLDLIKDRYRDSVKQEVLTDLMRTTITEALKKVELAPVDAPIIESIKEDDNQGMEYVATFEIYPTIELSSFDNITVEKLVTTVTESDIDKTLAEIQKQQATWNVVSRPAQDGDRITVDFEGLMDGVAFAGGTAKDIPVILGSKSMIPGFEEGLLGIAAGEERAINVTFPEQYAAKNLAGKPAVFNIKAKKVEEASLPLIDDSFAEKLAIKSKTVEALRAEVRKQLEQVVNNKLKSHTKNQVFQQLLKINEIDIPRSMVEREMERLQEQAKTQYRTASGQSVQIPTDVLEQQATQHVGLGLLFHEARKRFDISVDAQRVKAHIEELAASYEKPQDVVSWYYAKKERLASVEAIVLEDQLVEEILGHAKIEEKPMSYQDLINLAE